MRKAQFTTKASPKFTPDTRFRIHVLPRTYAVFPTDDQDKVESISSDLAKWRTEIREELSAELREEKQRAKEIVESCLGEELQRIGSGAAEAKEPEERGESLTGKIHRMVKWATRTLAAVPDDRGRRRLSGSLNEEINDYLDLEYRKQYFQKIKRKIERQKIWPCSIEAF
jgi:hypothetical protein